MADLKCGEAPASGLARTPRSFRQEVWVAAAGSLRAGLAGFVISDRPLALPRSGPDSPAGFLTTAMAQKKAPPKRGLPRRTGRMSGVHRSRDLALASEEPLIGHTVFLGEANKLLVPTNGCRPRHGELRRSGWLARADRLWRYSPVPLLGLNWLKLDVAKARRAASRNRPGSRSPPLAFSTMRLPRPPI